MNDLKKSIWDYGTEMTVSYGDGSWSKYLNNGMCPKCQMTLEGHSCSLTIVDRPTKSDDTDDMETHLVPDESFFAERGERMPWSEAVSVIESIVMTEAENIEDHDGDSVFAETVRRSWQRILQG